MVNGGGITKHFDDLLMISWTTYARISCGGHCPAISSLLSKAIKTHALMSAQHRRSISFIVTLSKAQLASLLFTIFFSALVILHGERPVQHFSAFYDLLISFNIRQTLQINNASFPSIHAPCIFLNSGAMLSHIVLLGRTLFSLIARIYRVHPQYIIASQRAIPQAHRS